MKVCAPQSCSSDGKGHGCMSFFFFFFRIGVWVEVLEIEFPM